MDATMRACPACSYSVARDVLNCPSCEHRLRKPRRAITGMFTAVLFWWYASCSYVIFAMATNETIYEAATSAPSAAAQADAFTGLGIGFGLMLTLWLIGTVITGLFMLMTRRS